MSIEFSAQHGIATVRLNRPEKLNAFAGHMRRDLAEALERAGTDDTVRVIVITGEGRGFCAGGDVERMNELMRDDNANEFSRMLGAGRRVVTTIRTMTKPVIASINGAASGAGMNLALACDMRIAAESATFSQSFVKIGMHPDWGGTYFLPRIVPPNIACEMFFLGDKLDAQTALRLGIVNRVVADAELEAETQKLAERLRDQSPTVLAAAKHAVYLSSEAGLEQMLQYETEAQMRCFTTKEARNGVNQFLDKRETKTTSD